VATELFVGFRSAKTRVLSRSERQPSNEDVMKILVCLKQIIDPEVSPRDFQLDRENLTAAQGSANLVTNIFCENALETALQLREKSGGEITALTFGSGEAEDVLRKALALKVDHAVQVINPTTTQSNSAGAAHVLAAAIKKLDGFDLVMLGREAGDWGEGQTAAILAEELGLPFVAFVESIDASDDGVTVRRQTDIGSEDLNANTPLVVSITNNDANVPRIPKTRDIMMAHRKELTAWSLEDVGLAADAVQQVADKTQVVDLFIPERDSTCEFVTGDSIDEKVDAFAQRIVDIVRSV
jgi:electron transfer flavoprotein beta subunit